MSPSSIAWLRRHPPLLAGQHPTPRVLRSLSQHGPSRSSEDRHAPQSARSRRRCVCSRESRPASRARRARARRSARRDPERRSRAPRWCLAAAPLGRWPPTTALATDPVAASSRRTAFELLAEARGRLLRGAGLQWQLADAHSRRRRRPSRRGRRCRGSCCSPAVRAEPVERGADGSAADALHVTHGTHNPRGRPDEPGRATPPVIKAPLGRRPVVAFPACGSSASGPSSASLVRGHQRGPRSPGACRAFRGSLLPEQVADLVAHDRLVPGLSNSSARVTSSSARASSASVSASGATIGISPSATRRRLGLLQGPAPGGLQRLHRRAGPGGLWR